MDKDLTISSAAVSDRGLSDKRPQNEDSYLEMPAIGIFAVADGVGGAQAGEVASQMAVEILGEAFSHLASTSDAESGMLAAMEQANSSIFQMAHELPSLASMATTIVALHLKDDIATIGHVGDSRIYRVDPSGNIFRETDDHSIVAEEVRAGRMTEEQADNHPSKNVISRALGAEGTVQPDLKTIMVEPGTSFLLCSDGITRHVNDAEIRNLLSHGSDLEKVCQSLKDLVFERGAEDNMTAVLVRVGDFVEPAKDTTTEEMPSIDTLEGEEPTVATARATSPFDSKADDEDLLELVTGELQPPIVGNDSIVHESRREPAADVSNSQTVKIAPPVEQAAADRDAGFSMFGTSDETAPHEKTSGSGGIGNLIVGLLIGAVVGFAIFYFVVKPGSSDVSQQSTGLSEMKSENVPFTSYEKLRRTVDANPDGYIKEVPPAEDAADFYLLGRAYLLTGDTQNARFSLTEAQKRLPKADETNLKVLTDDIAQGLAISSDPEALKRMRAEIDANRQPTNANAAANANNSGPQRSPTPPPIVN